MMRSFLAALALALAAAAPAVAAPAAAVAPAAAPDRTVKLTLDGRPVDRSGGSAVMHNGIIYGDVVDLVKSFNGVLTFQGPATVVTVNGTNATFTVGSRTAKVGLGSVVMRGPAFLRNGDLFVPLDTFIVRIANAKLQVSPDRTRADIYVNANPLN